ncbi:MAG: amidohydrolase family protein [Gemmatimonadota bacterium]
MPLTPRFSIALALAAIALSACARKGAPGNEAVYDLVILNGRVMDPASGLDSIRSVGISGGTIRILSASGLTGRDTLDARGMVVAPGFIDLHQHAQDSAAYRVEVLDGTTTALELEGGTADIDAWYAEREGRTPSNYGASIGHELVRKRVMGDTGTNAPVGPAKYNGATDEELAEMVRQVDHGLDRGAIAVGMLIEFTPGARPWEILQMFRAAARHDATVHVHMRALPEPQYYLETEEIIAAAAATGAAAHIVHIQSSGGEDTPRMLELVGGAQARHIDVTAEVYPYTASMSRIEAAEFDGWESWKETKFDRFEWATTGEKLTRQSFPRFRKLGGLVVEYNNSEEVVAAAVAHPLTMIASDGILHDGVGHPRVAGTFARVLGRYARDAKVMSLMEALRKTTIAPAQRMERRVPAMARKGRVQPGADADLVVFDAATVIDRATYREPALPPVGIRDVLVNGVRVVRGGVVLEGVHPGRAVRAAVQGEKPAGG